MCTSSSLHFQDGIYSHNFGLDMLALASGMLENVTENLKGALCKSALYSPPKTFYPWLAARTVKWGAWTDGDQVRSPTACHWPTCKSTPKAEVTDICFCVLWSSSHLRHNTQAIAKGREGVSGGNPWDWKLLQTESRQTEVKVITFSYFGCPWSHCHIWWKAIFQWNH